MMTRSKTGNFSKVRSPHAVAFYASSRPTAVLFNAMTLEPMREVQDRLENNSQGVKTSTLSHNSKYLVTACNDLLSQIETSSWKSTARYIGAPTTAHSTPATENIKSRAFTTDRKRLVAAYGNMVVIKTTSER